MEFYSKKKQQRLSGYLHSNEAFLNAHNICIQVYDD